MLSDPAPRTREGQPYQRRFIVTLCRTDDGTSLVRSCEVIGEGFRNRTSFGQNAAIAQVFRDEVAIGIGGCLEGLTASNEVRSYPDLVIEAPGLLLFGAHLIVTAVENDELHVICRFGRFFGGINHAFQQAIGFESSPIEETERLSALVFSDLVLPVLNICQSAQQVVERGGVSSEPMARALTEKWHELQFRVELLKRFVEFTPPGPFTGKDAPVYLAANEPMPCYLEELEA